MSSIAALACAISSVAAATISPAGSRETPIAVLETTDSTFVIEKSDRWVAHKSENDAHRLVKSRSGGIYSLSDDDLEVLEQCFKERVCVRKLPLNWSPAHKDDSGSRFGPGTGLQIGSIGEGIFVAYRLENANEVRFIDGLSGRVISGGAGASANAFDVKDRTKIFAVCEQTYACDIKSSDFFGKATHVVAHVDFKVVDLEVRNRVAYALTKRASQRQPPPLLRWAGHGRYAEDWFVTEVDLTNGQVKSWPLMTDIVNAGGNFVNKWSK